VAPAWGKKSEGVAKLATESRQELAASGSRCDLRRGLQPQKGIKPDEASEKNGSSLFKLPR
tara:strand:+ start:1152 stop:1334 length:183 start_codon:yes stop_codon:yes gene_type:complete